MNAFRPIILLIASISFGLGISLPLMQFEKLYFFTETPSLISIIAGLWVEGEILLSIVTSGLANAISQPGLWFFAISAIAVAVSVSKMKSAENK